MSLTSRVSVVARLQPRTVLISLWVALATTLGVTVAPAAAVTPTPYNTNLVKNPGFEAGGRSLDGNYWVPVPSWTTSFNATVVAYGTPGGFPTAAEGSRISGGQQFFTSGQPTNAGNCGEAEQVVSIRGRNAAIDSGHVLVIVKARLGTYATQPDTANVTISMGSSSSFNLPSKTGTGERLLQASARVILPAGRRALYIHLYSTNTAGYCDAYFDKISLKIAHV